MSDEIEAKRERLLKSMAYVNDAKNKVLAEYERYRKESNDWLEECDRQLQSFDLLIDLTQAEIDRLYATLAATGETSSPGYAQQEDKADEDARLEAIRKFNECDTSICTFPDGGNCICNIQYRALLAAVDVHDGQPPRVTASNAGVSFNLPAPEGYTSWQTEPQANCALFPLEAKGHLVDAIQFGTYAGGGVRRCEEIDWEFTQFYRVLSPESQIIKSRPEADGHAGLSNEGSAPEPQSTKTAGEAVAVPRYDLIDYHALGRNAYVDGAGIDDLPVECHPHSIAAGEFRDGWLAARGPYVHLGDGPRFDWTKRDTSQDGQAQAPYSTAHEKEPA